MKNINRTKEWSQEKKLKEEIKRLKKENSQLRKAMEKAHSYNEVLEITKQKIDEENNKDKLKKDWLCFKCGRGFLKIKRIYQVDGVYYIRMCDNNNCDKKTNKQKWSKNVKGIDDE